LVFVLLLNREQLERSIQQAYGGEKEDAARYLGKFVHFFLTLPNSQSRGNNGRHDLQAFCKALATLHGFTQSSELQSFIEVLAKLAPHFGLSLRDLQRAFVYLRLAKNFDGYSRGFAYLIALKLRYPEVFALLQIDPVGGSKRAIEIMEKVDQNAPKNHWEFFLLLHRIDAGLVDVNGLSIPQQNIVDGWMAGTRRTKLFQIIAEIDLPEIE
jgi:KAP family P-loop domain